MRIPLRHAPPEHDPPRLACAYLSRLVEAAHGLPLGPAAAQLSSPRSRGRHGTALQWHLGLASHDAEAQPDWEGRIEIKLVTVWRSAGAVVCDKQKICDVEIDPWRKLANALFVFADRTTRVVVGHAFVHLGGPVRERLALAWQQDTHFDSPALFVESRDGAAGPAPAYYLSAGWFAAERLLPLEHPAVLGAPRPVLRGGDPVLTTTVASELGADGVATIACPRCGAPMRLDAGVLREHGSAPAHHGLPLPRGCAAREHIVVDRARLPRPGIGNAAEAIAALEGRDPPGHLARLADRVAEPEDHGH